MNTSDVIPKTHPCSMIPMYKNLPSITALKCFEATARHNSFSKAAEELFLTQSAVSRQIKNLESLVDCVLFERVKKRIYLTESGEIYKDKIEVILIDLYKATQELSGSTSGRIIFGIEDALTTKWLLPKFKDFQHSFPDIEVEFVTDPYQLYEHREGYDVGILYGDGQWHEFNSLYLMKEEYVAVCSPELLAMHGECDEIKDILKFPFIHHSSSPSSSQYWLSQLGLADDEIAKLPGIHLERFHQLIRAAEYGQGVAILPHYFTKEKLKNGRLVLAYAQPLVSDDAYYIVYPKNKEHDEKIKILVAWLATWRD